MALRGPARAAAPDSTTFASYLDDVQLARDLQVASDPSGTLLVAMTTSETGRSTDGSVSLGQDEVLVLAISRVNQAPTVINFTQREIVATSPDGVALQLTAIAIDPDGDAITADWRGPFGTISNAWPAGPGAVAQLGAAVRLPSGESSITLTVYDDVGGHVVTDTFTVTVSGVNTVAGDFGGQPQVVRPPDDNLPVGAGVTAGRVEVRFTGQVNAPGLVWMRTRTDLAPPPPFGLQLGSSPFYYDIGYYLAGGGPAPVQGNVRICIDYSGMSFVDPARLQLLMLTGGSWTAVTPTELVTDPADFKFRMLCADRPADSAFGTYALMAPADAATAISTIAADFVQPVSAVYDVNPAANRNYLYIADGAAFHVYRRNLSDGTTTIVAGDGAIGINPPDNVDATQSHVGPYGLALDAFGNLFIADASHCSIRRVDAITNIITTVAGTRTPDENLCGHAGDGGPGNAARVGRAGHMTFDAAGNLLFSDEWTPEPGPVIGYIRRLAAVNGVIPADGSGVISTVAGNGSSELPVEGAHPLSSGSYVYDLAFGPDGNLYVSFVSAIFRIAPGAGSDASIDGSSDERFERIAGGNYDFAYLLPFAGDGGLARDAFVQNPMAIAVLPDGDLLYAETFMNRIRRISGGADHVVNGVNAASCATEDADCERITTIADFTDNAGAVFPPPSNGDGLALQTRLGYPIHIALDPTGGVAIVEIGQGFTRVRHLGVSGGVVVPPPPPIGVTLLAPLAGAKVFVNVPVDVRWQSTGGPTSFTVELSRTAAEPFTAIATCANLPASAASCTWVPTGAYTPEARIRIVARNAVQTAIDTSGEFQINITPPVLTVTVPNTAVRWAIGSTQLIRWSHNLGAAALVTLELSRDGGASWETLGPPQHNVTTTVGQMDWVVTGPPTAAALVRATWTDGPATDVSNVAFAIEDPRITVTAPNGGQVWALDGQRTIAWTHNLGTAFPVSVELSRDGGDHWTTIAGSVPNTSATVGQFSWLVTGPVTAQARVRVRTVNPFGAAGFVADDSDGNFTIASRIHVDYPNTALTWAAGSQQRVSWTHPFGAAQQFDLDVSTDGGLTWAAAARNVVATGETFGSAAIVLPNTQTTQTLVRVSPAGAPTEGDVNDVPFTLVPATVRVTTPNTNVNWVLGTTHSIYFTHNLGSSLLNRFDVAVSFDSGQTWAGVANNVNNGYNFYSWTVAGPVTTHARVRVRWSEGTASAEDISDVDFTISARVHVTSPNTAVTWIAGSQHNITWTHNYTATQAFDIDFSGDGGATWSRMVSGVPAASATTGSYSAVMPNIITAGALIRVTASGQPRASDSDTSDSTFALIPPRIIVRP